MFEMTFLKNQHEEYEALAQIAEMERDQAFNATLPIYTDRANEHSANYCRVGDVTAEVGVTTSTPLTCKGCMAYTGVPMVSKERCNTCIRSSKHTDLFEPKGDAT